MVRDIYTIHFRFQNSHQKKSGEHNGQAISSLREITRFGNFLLITAIAIRAVWLLAPSCWNHSSRFCTLNRCNSAGEKLFSVKYYLFIKKKYTKNVRKPLRKKKCSHRLESINKILLLFNIRMWATASSVFLCELIHTAYARDKRDDDDITNRSVQIYAFH